LAAGFLLLVSFSFITEIGRRFIGTNPDTLSVTSTVLQVALAVGAGSTLTKVGREQLERLLSWFGIRQEVHHSWKLGIALCLLLLMFGVHRSLPFVARYYNDRGLERQQKGNLVEAIGHYERAVRLDPHYAQAHYNLATAYEDAVEYDKAISAYQLALRADSAFYSPANNLARLYLLRRSDAAAALDILDGVLARANTEAARDPTPTRSAYLLITRYTLLKNRGWANLSLGNLERAEDDLRDALTLREEGAAAHCLLAQVFEAKTARDPVSGINAAMPEWEECIRLHSAANQGDIVEAVWLARGNERLHPRNRK
jgi:tetratricopeptide (TPR) repeat protein